MTRPAGETPPAAEESAAPSPAASPAAASAESTPIVEVKADPLMAMVILGAAIGGVFPSGGGD